MNNKKYLVYMHTSPNGKSYIGQTFEYQRRCSDHKRGNKCILFSKAIKKYGWDNFKHEILKDGLTIQEANFWEEFYIKYYNTMNPNGYNLTSGGLNSEYSKISKAKMSEKKKGKPTWNKGKKLSEEHNRKNTLTKIGRKQTKETIEKRISKIKGKKRSKEFCDEMRKLNKGRTFSPETLKRMSEGQKRRFAKAKGEIVNESDHYK